MDKVAYWLDEAKDYITKILWDYEDEKTINVDFGRLHDFIDYAENAFSEAILEEEFNGA